MNKVYEIITERFIDGLEKNLSFKRGWTCDGKMPFNMVSKKAYRGINAIMLLWTDYERKEWLSFKQIKDKNGEIKKGEKGTPIIFYKLQKYKDKNPFGEDEEKSFPILRYYLVWNIEQTTLEIPKDDDDKKPIDTIKECEIGLEKYEDKPIIKEGGDKAYYSPSEDRIQIPSKKQFDKSERYYEVLFHELSHSTGHKKRLDRNLTGGFGTDKYSFEELIAELGNAFLCANTGIKSDEENSQAYINSWITKLNKNPKWIIEASSKAQKSTDYILNSEVKK